MHDVADLAPFPLPLSAYAATDGASLLQTLQARIDADPFNAIATLIFVAAIVHTFAAARFKALAHSLQEQSDARAVRAGRVPRVSVRAEVMHFLGEVEVIFGLWVVPLLVAITLWRGWPTAIHYVNDTVTYAEPIFVVVIMALASTRPVVELAESMLRRVVLLVRDTPASWWVTVLVVAPLLGSFITEPAAMTIAALLLDRRFYALNPSRRLKYATLGLLFVNVSIGGTLTHFAAPPVLMVARPWGWDTQYMLMHIGWRAAVAITLATAGYFLVFRHELRALSSAPDSDIDSETGDSALPVPAWITVAHLVFMAWTVANAHYPALVVGGFLFFLGFDRATAVYSTLGDFKTPMLVGFFLVGLVIHGGLQAWWIAPLISRLPETPLFAGATVLTAFNDNALITYLATLVPHLDEGLQRAVLEGAVTGGGLTVIANAPNPAGQALLSKHFDDDVQPLALFCGAAIPTAIAAAMFRLL